MLSLAFLLQPTIECRRVYRQSVAAENLCLSVAAAVQPVQREEFEFGVAGLEAEAILSRTVAVAAGESYSPELGAASEFVRTSDWTVVVVGEIVALELAEVFESVYAVDSQLVSDTVLVELSDEHLAVVGLVDAGSRYSESPWLYCAMTAKATEPGTWLPTEREWVLPVSG